MPEKPKPLFDRRVFWEVDFDNQLSDYKCYTQTPLNQQPWIY